MNSVKLSITCRAALQSKYDAKALARIDAAVKKWIAADVARGIQTIHLAVDVADEMKPFKVPAVTGKVTAQKVKNVVDALVARLTPDYIVLFGSTDVVPMFEVDNPTLNATGDADADVPTDNPYACSQKFDSSKRSSFLVPDRVVGRIPDLLGSADPSWLIAYLSAATSWRSLPEKRYAKDLLICAEVWKDSGSQCVKSLSREKSALLQCPPSGNGSKLVKSRHKALFHMVKCHGAPVTSVFFGQRGGDFPEALRSVSLEKRTRKATVIGSMCCFGASVFDPDDAFAAHRGEPPIASVYLRQGASGFFGSTGTAWVGAQMMQCADRVVTTFLKGVLRGASLGRAALDAKQQFAQDNEKAGDQIDAADEKTLMQFVLLGDPSIHPVIAASPAGVVSAAMLGATPSPGVALARRQRRAVRHRLGAALRDGVPKRTAVASKSVPASVEAAAKQLADTAGAGFKFAMAAPRVQRVTTTVKQPEIAVKAAGLITAAAGRTDATATVDRTNYQYYWAARYHKTGAPIGEIRLVAVQADADGTVLRSHLLASSTDSAERRSARETTAAARTAHRRGSS